MDFNFSFQKQLRKNGLMQMDKYNTYTCADPEGETGGLDPITKIYRVS